MKNENENEKKGLLSRLTGNKKIKKTSCCCAIELEEIPDESKEKEGKEPKDKGGSCCN
jgi:hypothetical protein